MKLSTPFLAMVLVVSSAQALAAVRYVDVNTTNPEPPYTNWATAAKVIQDAVDVAQVGDTVLVTNGVYEAGSRVAGMITNRVAITKAISVESMNGPAFTVIKGNALPYVILRQMRCAYLASDARLSGFTLTNGCYITTPGSGILKGGGGGVYCASPTATVSNCVIAANIANGDGGGANGGTLIDCILVDNQGSGGGAAYCILNRCRLGNNSAYANAGGAFDCTLNDCAVNANRLEGPNEGGGGAAKCLLNNCTVISNSVISGAGGTLSSTQYNSIVYWNVAPLNANYAEGARSFTVLANCCTVPLPSKGAGNFTNAPLFVKPESGDFHLQPNSPCINAGNNTYTTNLLDLDGRPRVRGGTVDIGAFECQEPASRISYVWLQRYGLAIDGSADSADPDSDGMSTWNEWQCGTDPLNPLSALRIVAITNAATGLRVTWQSVSDRSYRLERAISLAAPGFSPISSNIAGQPTSTSLLDLGATNAGPYFYRVGVQP